MQDNYKIFLGVLIFISVVLLRMIMFLVIVPFLLVKVLAIFGIALTFWNAFAIMALLYVGVQIVKRI